MRQSKGVVKRVVQERFRSGRQTLGVEEQLSHGSLRARMGRWSQFLEKGHFNLEKKAQGESSQRKMNVGDWQWWFRKGKKEEFRCCFPNNVLCRHPTLLDPLESSVICIEVTIGSGGFYKAGRTNVES